MLPKKVLNRFVLVEFDENEAKTDSGIILPNMELKSSHRKAKVIMISRLAHEDSNISEGDTVMVDKTAAGETYDKYEFITIGSIHTVI